jgi:hypothetical protein
VRKGLSFKHRKGIVILSSGGDMGKMFQTVCSDGDAQAINPTARKRNMYGYLKKLKMNLPASLKTRMQKMELSLTP